MDDAGLLIAGAAGMLLGAFHFGTLWLVVRRLSRARWPALLLGVTGVLRMGVVVAGFCLFVDERWERLASALVGFLVVRVALTRRLGGRGTSPRAAACERMTPSEE